MFSLLLNFFAFCKPAKRSLAKCKKHSGTLLNKTLAFEKNGPPEKYLIARMMAVSPIVRDVDTLVAPDLGMALADDVVESFRSDELKTATDRLFATDRKRNTKLSCVAVTHSL